MKKIYTISGMHCSACATLIRMQIEELEGVYAVKVNMADSQAEIEFNDQKVTEQAIRDAIEGAGTYTVTT